MAPRPDHRHPRQSRALAIGATAARRFTATAARRATETAIGEHGAPRQRISDNGGQFISRDGHQPVHFQQRLAAMGIRQLSSRLSVPVEK